MSSAKGDGGGADTWCTPSIVLECVRAVGSIGLDPCTNADNPTAARSIYTPEIDGLAQPWDLDGNGGLVYVNPPYSNVGEWALKAANASAAVPVIMLVAARTDTKWWRQLWGVADAVAFWNGRLKFVGAPTSAPFPSALFGLNVSQRRFRHAFEPVATVVLP